MEAQRPPSRFNFSILGLMALTTLVAVDLFLLIYYPGVGVPVVFLGAAPLVRTYLNVRRARSAGSPLSRREIVLFMTASASVLVAAVVAAGVAIFCVCWGVIFFYAGFVRHRRSGGLGFDEATLAAGNVELALIISGVAGLIALIAVTVWLWPKCRKLLHRRPEIAEPSMSCSSVLLTPAPETPKSDVGPET